MFYVEVYAGMLGLLLIVSLIRNQLLVLLGMNSSVKLHDSLFGAVIRAPMLFFETNSAGMFHVPEYS